MYDLSHCKNAITYLATEKKNDLCSLLLQRWNVLKEILATLQVPYKATIALQRQTLTLSDAYVIWHKMDTLLKSDELKRICQTNFRECLLKAVNNRMKGMCNNATTWSALFLDPRYRHFILRDEEKKNAAIGKLTNLWQRIEFLSNNVQAIEQRY